MTGPRILSRKLTPLGAGLAIVGLLATAWGILLGSWAKASIGVAVLFIPLASSLLSQLAVGRLMENLHRRIPDVPVEGYVTPVILTVRNGDWLVPLIAELEDMPPPRLTRVGPSKVRLVSPPGAEARAVYYLVARSGKRAFGPVKARVYDPLGLYEVAVEWQPRGDPYMRGKPSSKKYEVEESLEREVSTLVRRYVRGFGLEFYEVREYREGDDPRLIDWKATARLGQLIVKEMRKEASSPVIILLAPGPEGDKGEPYRTFFERASRIAAGLAEKLAGLGIAVGYIGLVEDPVLVPPTAGPSGLQAVLAGLAETPPSGTPPEDVVSLARRYLRDYVRTRPLLLLLAPSDMLNVAERLRNISYEFNGRLIVVGVSGEEGSR